MRGQCQYEWRRKQLFFSQNKCDLVLIWVRQMTFQGPTFATTVARMPGVAKKNGGQAKPTQTCPIGQVSTWSTILATYCTVCRQFPAKADKNGWFFHTNNSYRKQNLESHAKSIPHMACVEAKNARLFLDRWTVVSKDFTWRATTR